MYIRALVVYRVFHFDQYLKKNRFLLLNLNGNVAFIYENQRTETNWGHHYENSRLFRSVYMLQITCCRSDTLNVYLCPYLGSFLNHSEISKFPQIVRLSIVPEFILSDTPRIYDM